MKIAFRLALSIFVCLALAGGYTAVLSLRGNFHTVLDGIAYRSAQPSADDLARWTKANGLRSVVNLRGRQDGADWYDAEIDAARTLGLAHFDFAMSADKMLKPERVQTLIDLLRDAPKPVLIHCRAGADRTGLAAALMMTDLTGNEDAAEAQISFLFGHISIPYTAAWPMDQSWEAVEPSLGLTS